MSKTAPTKAAILKSVSKKPATPTKKNLIKQHSIANLQQRWDILPSRDQWALSLLAVFLVAVIGGIGGYSLHQSAADQTQAYQEAISDYFWLRGQASNVNTDAIQGDSNQNGAQAIEVRAREYLQQAGALNPQVLRNGDKVQISFEHPNQAIASKIMAGFTNQGLDITRLNMVQNNQDKSIQIQATLSS